MIASVQQVLTRLLTHAGLSFAGRRTEPWSTSPEDILIPLRDGTILSAVLAKPRGDQPCCGRVVVMVHGFAAEKTENGLFTAALAELVTHQHWALLYDWRGVGNSKGDFTTSDLMVHARDFIEVVEWIKTRAHVGGNRVVAVGFSLGAAVIGLALKKGLKLGGIALLSPALRPKHDIYPRYSTDESISELHAQGYILKNDVRIGPQFLKSLREPDVSRYMKEVGIPILVCHGTEDVRIPYNVTEAMYRRGRLGEQAFFLSFDGATHSFRPEDVHRPRLYSSLCEWMDQLEDVSGTNCAAGLRTGSMLNQDLVLGETRIPPQTLRQPSPFPSTSPR